MSDRMVDADIKNFIASVESTSGRQMSDSGAFEIEIIAIIRTMHLPCARRKVKKWPDDAGQSGAPMQAWM